MFSFDDLSRLLPNIRTAAEKGSELPGASHLSSAVSHSPAAAGDDASVENEQAAGGEVMWLKSRYHRNLRGQRRTLTYSRPFSP